jgi:hypothetical protein
MGMIDERGLARWLRERLGGDQVRAEWVQLMEASWDALSSEKLGALYPPDRIQALVEAYASKERIADIVRPMVRAGLQPFVESLREDRAPLGRLVPLESRRAIQDLVARKGVVHPEWIQKLFKEEAIEEISADTLYRAIRDFSTIIPRLIQNFSPLGKLGKLSGGIGQRVIEEMEKLIEPEIKRFLEKGTRRALDGAAKFTVDHLDDPASIALRRNVVDFALDQNGPFHAHPLSDEAIREIDRIAQQIALHVASLPETQDRIRAGIEKARARLAEKTVADALKELGIEQRPPFEAWVGATWPAIQRALDTEPLASWLERLASEILAEVRTSDSGQS